MKKKVPLKIVIDTSALRRDVHFKKESGQWIKNLAKEGYLEIHIPYIVENEIKSQRREYHKENLLNSFNKFKKNIIEYKTKNSLQNSLNKLEKNLQLLFEKTIKQEDDFFEKGFFKLENNPSKHTLNVFRNYFNGEGNFKNVKYREDIPDAFVYEYVNSLATSENTKIVILAHDKGLREALSKINNVIVFEDMESFVEKNETIKNLITRIKSKSPYRNISKILKRRVHDYLFFESGYALYDLTDLHLEEWTFFSETLMSIGNEAIIVGNEGWFIIDNSFKFFYFSKREGRASWYIDVDLAIEHNVTSQVFNEHFKKWNVDHVLNADNTFHIKERVRAKVEMIAEMFLEINPEDFSSTSSFKKAILEDDNFRVEISGTGSIKIIHYLDRE